MADETGRTHAGQEHRQGLIGERSRSVVARQLAFPGPGRELWKARRDATPDSHLAKWRSGRLRPAPGLTPPAILPDNEGVRGAQSVLPTENERKGGLAVWAPSIVPPIGAELTDEQKLACTFRILARDGFSENISGHITWQRDGLDTLLVNPWGLWWSEIAASDMCTVDMEANVVAGKWDVTPAIHIHTELHRRRRDARVVMHNHPYYVCVMAALGRLPEIVHQSGTVYDGDMALISEYGGEVDSAELGGELADQIGTANVIILGNHGIIVTGADHRRGHLPVGHHRPGLPPGLRRAPAGTDTAVASLATSLPGIKASMIERGSDVYFAGAVRQLLRPRAGECGCDLSSTISRRTGTSPRPATRGTDGHLPARPAGSATQVHGHLGRRPYCRATACLREAGAARSLPIGRPGSLRKTTAARRGSTTASSCPTSGSTPSLAVRSRSGPWSRPASTRCGGAPGISTSASPTWTSTASTPR